MNALKQIALLTLLLGSTITMPWPHFMTKLTSCAQPQYIVRCAAVGMSYVSFKFACESMKDFCAELNKTKQPRSYANLARKGAYSASGVLVGISTAWYALTGRIK